MILKEYRKMINRKVKIVALFFGAFTLNLMAQNPDLALQKVYEKYQSLENLSFEVEARTYKSQEDRSGKIAMRGKLRKRGDQYYSKMDDAEILVNGTDLLSIDHHTKSIVIGKVKDAAEQQPDLLVFSPDSIRAEGGQLLYVGTAGEHEIYRVLMPHDFIHQTDIYINKNHLMSRCIFYYQSLPELESAHYKLDVHYTNISTKAISDHIFSEDRFVKRKGRKAVEASVAFQDYRVEVIDYESAFQEAGDW